MSPDGSAKAATGHIRIAIANVRNSKHARTRIRRELNHILYPGALTSRLKRYAAEPAPDGANLTSINERTANGTGKAGHRLPLVASAQAQSGLGIATAWLRQSDIGEGRAGCISSLRGDCCGVNGRCEYAARWSRLNRPAANRQDDQADLPPASRVSTTRHRSRKF